MSIHFISFFFQNQTDKLSRKKESMFLTHALGNGRHFPEFSLYAYTIYGPLCYGHMCSMIDNNSSHLLELENLCKNLENE